jgi:hypothetical protein
MTDSGFSDALQTLIAELVDALKYSLTEGYGWAPKARVAIAKGETCLAGMRAAICTRVTASPQPEDDHRFLKTAALMSGCSWKCHLQADKFCSSCHRIADALQAAYDEGFTDGSRPVKQIRQAIDDKLLVYGDGLIDKGALYREVLNDESRSPDGDGHSSPESAPCSTASSFEPPRTNGERGLVTANIPRAGSEPADSHTKRHGENVDWSNDGGATWHPIESGPPRPWMNSTLIRPRPAREEPSAVVDSCGIVEQEPER